MLNPLRSEPEAFKFFGFVLAVAVVIGLAVIVLRAI
jgi:hypothetical protein